MSVHRHTQEGKSVRVVLAGGMDPGTGAGIARDLLTAAALGASAILVGTAWTEQGRVTTIEAREPEQVRVAMTAALAEAGTTGTAVKIGMVATAPIAQAVQAVKTQLGPRSSWPKGTQVALASIDPGTGGVVSIYAGAVSYTHLTLPTICSV